MPNNKLSSIIIVFSVFLSFILGASNCQKQCRDQQDCLRICQCELPDLNQRVTCGLGFTCDTGTDLCSEDYDNFSCGEICSKYQPSGLCNSQQCVTENDCNKEAICNAIQGDGSTISYTCTQKFSCNTDYGLCGADYTLADALALCNICFSTQTGISNVQTIVPAAN